MRNSTIIPRKKQLSCGCFDYNFSKNRCKYHATIESTMKRMEKETEKVIAAEDLSDLIEDADAVFSQYIRLKYADKCGKVVCYTCGNVKHWSMMQNGHYIKRSHLYLRWDERNCRPQDADCNEFKHGNIPAFTKKLELEYPGITEILNEEMRIVYKPTREEIKQKVAQYAPLVRSMKAKLLIP